MGTIIHTIRYIPHGKYSRKGLHRYQAILMGVVFFFFFISWLLYPAELHYSILTHTISYLGDYLKNPRGWWLFSFGFILLGLGSLPIVWHTHHRVVFIEKRWGWAGTMGFMIGCMGIALVGIFPDVHGDDFLEDMSMGKAHNLVAIATFIAFAVGITIYAFLFLVTHYPKLHKGKPNIYPNVKTMPFFVLFAIIGLSTLFTQIYARTNGIEWPGPGLLSFPLWEWALSLMILFLINWLPITLPFGVPGNTMDVIL